MPLKTKLSLSLYRDNYAVRTRHGKQKVAALGNANFCQRVEVFLWYITGIGEINYPIGYIRNYQERNSVRTCGGGWWSPSAMLMLAEESLAQAQFSGISNGISSSMQTSSEPRFS